MTPSERICSAMWHKGRREFLPWLGEEIDRRAGVTVNERRAAVLSGLLISDSIKPGSRDDEQEYTITTRGKGVVMNVRQRKEKQG